MPSRGLLDAEVEVDIDGNAGSGKHGCRIMVIVAEVGSDMDRLVEANILLACLVLLFAPMGALVAR